MFMVNAKIFFKPKMPDVHKMVKNTLKVRQQTLQGF